MTNKEKTLGQKVDEMTNKISEVSSELWEKFEETKKETQKVAHGVEKWWKTTKLESRITTILGGILVAIAFWNLKGIIWQLAILVAGILAITGMFDSVVKEIIILIKGQIKSYSQKGEVSQSSKEEKTNTKSS